MAEPSIIKSERNNFGDVYYVVAILESGEKIMVSHTEGFNSGGLVVSKLYAGIFPKIIYRCDNVEKIKKLFPIKNDAEKAYIGMYSDLDFITNIIIHEYKSIVEIKSKLG
ncbi:MAG: hypothetical protein A2312_01445 [Candidatus Staskawiczbacteria bacterium RIFOXYB2_FULL_32_9]|uniref:Uncharacterized protein n=1 Tax=Candidatus Staskawiczbacteria bacterium RIFOXYD1_FULL_32_13 TaxID=1802234 RepID=A0A1G2JNH0_9BACT|nr:MAG: hypothetical protein UR22_C0023G0007 [Parcubacteria group bacterium GW2011_GWC2_32_10]OGZ77123.1 MAG: hypothetical protein A2256_01055 [Candidatus Staskawiczbacteria bacterium RIFOXYA2_FULL_32_7]OGZ79697.1 MAG: hypothetical protein A2360_02105 [Candidatus Staskawiczbacteria bacterium RIFOXYB1_FULL_32_11]OGZ84349.1 MAG: hypothetical protein A2312_01445 [Candidatus Staskawiczbacteria bacterium RIFOXYB2_FULL_32_9]OGZ85524.1 MAG: hypothetical protein A2463_02540 [Candidatus Staskawiczbacter